MKFNYCQSQELSYGKLSPFSTCWHFQRSKCLNWVHTSEMTSFHTIIVLSRLLLHLAVLDHTRTFPTGRWLMDAFCQEMLYPMVLLLRHDHPRQLRLPPRHHLLQNSSHVVRVLQPNQEPLRHLGGRVAASLLGQPRLAGRGARRELPCTCAVTHVTLLPSCSWTKRPSRPAGGRAASSITIV